jgi:hypothetical protein
MNELPKVKETIEAYILERTGKRVNIVLDNPMRIRLHWKMMVAAYDWIQNNNKANN